MWRYGNPVHPEELTVLLNYFGSSIGFSAGSHISLTMVSTTDDSLRVGRVEVVPPAGAVDAAGATAELVPVKSRNSTYVPPVDLSDGVESPKQEDSDTPQRSKGKIALIMSALCVTLTKTTCIPERGAKTFCRLPFSLLRLIR